MEQTKQELAFLNVLMSAWVAGWYAGIDGQTTDEKKRIDCPEIMKRYPLYAAAPELLEACEVALLAMTHEPLHPEDVEFVKQAIAKATS